ncbi:hypothetical protein CDCA_CDCA01G0148 [Cyanidium caldarium]|uniref:phenylalanine--tRNA ligase n=1 Tax=Cyanidium caldarium TaxID=2771 RepID=A0AAV9IQ75_CYACA|nr:hypothetical protein CDCA_CDCA01G0148 [Cyanidium caldarium]
MAHATESVRQALEQAVVAALEADGVIADTRTFCQTKDVEHEELVAVLNSMVRRDLVRLEALDAEAFYELTEEGQRYAEHGTPEHLLGAALRAAPASLPAVSDLPALLQQVSSSHGVADAEVAAADTWRQRATIGMQQGIKQGVFRLDKSQKPPRLVLAVAADDGWQRIHKLCAALRALQDRHADQETTDAATWETALRRGLVIKRLRKAYRARPGARFAEARVQQLTDLTRDMLLDHSWESVHFKPFNFAAPGTAPMEGGRLHPLLKVCEQFRRIFLEMGFTEMDRSHYVESSFWNFDALFQPQQHPARDAHDTFFLSEPASCVRLGDGDVREREYVERVRQVHERGGYGSLGYRYTWSEAEARTCILRTHTTAVSARMLYRIAQEQRERAPGSAFTPRRLFSIDRVFRNETLDATHLAEFHQVEGLVAAPHLSLADLKGIIAQFFRRIGMPRLRFKPAHNPYTEPSMEIFAFHPELNKWVEIGNSGIFRPEMLLPMQLPPEVRVIAWGLSVERPTMILYGMRNIRDLFGHRVDLNTIRHHPVCRIGWE